MRPLKAPWLWLTLGWLLVAGATLGSLLPGEQVPMPRGYDKWLHAGTYFLLMVWFAGIYRAGRYAYVAGALALLGLALEFGQRLVATRAFEAIDLAANLIGIGAGLLLALAFLGGWCQRVEGWLYGQPSQPS